MKISIVIPAYNEESSIADTIRAALAQDYPDFEVIIVNNASSDKTAEVAARFPVRVVTEEKKGILFARERGRLEAKGELVANLDADCLPAPHWLSTGAKYFTDPEVAAVTGPYDYYDGTRVFRKVSFASQRGIYRLVNNLMDLLDRGGILIGGNNMIRASVLEAAGGYNTKIKFYGEDTDTARRVSEHGRIVFSKDFVMRTSARRFKTEGTVKITSYYLYHFLKAGVLPAIGFDKGTQVENEL
ncbi:MAG TPA: glycosyltransferase family 2 protein [Candidatus Paceibacterota bacterium]|nr:glycosyltransferase family 2 protein [Candidatus Paceibacterota bacterium]